MAFSSPEGQTPQKGQWLQDWAGLSRDMGAWGLWCPWGAGGHSARPGVGGAWAAQSGTAYQVGSGGHSPGPVQA